MLCYHLEQYIIILLIKFSTIKILKIHSTGKIQCHQNLGNLQFQQCPGLAVLHEAIVFAEPSRGVF